ncbi:hypothetical protein MDAP_000998 [Mitosporidium daphniae]|uniref:Uncharacterized protein n=1 Tax=Mitosporidium daphniae TaxID=1485682 RepID=A0A098VV28_9MICR|nr:uncharacterized protein DI09_133p30 [Mitosporidium daphniae]KGG52802.1 hypothetical protein DI09_133p30 [Mitosporidium daphniae]|eukprot:XP_013239238.1 uncharacterized protein DI09_133p30 [Mitosporidium daphniae]
MARIDQNIALPTYSYRPLDEKATGPRKTRLLKNLVTILLMIFLLLFLTVKYSNIFSRDSSIPGVFSIFKKTNPTSENVPKFTGSSKPAEKKDTPITQNQQKPANVEDKPNAKPSPLKTPEKFKTGSPLDAFLSGFVDPTVASQMLKFIATQAIDPIVSNIAPVLEELLPKERIELILRTTDSITSGELSGFEAIRRNFYSIFESLFLLVVNLAPSIGGPLIDDLVAIFDHLSAWMEHTDLSIAKYLGQGIAYGILPLIGYSDTALEQASRVFENGISKLLPDISKIDPSIFKSKEKLMKLIPSVSQIQPVVMSMFVQLASLKALQASVNSFSGSKSKTEKTESKVSSTNSTVSKNEKKHPSGSKHSRRRRRDPSDSDDDASYLDN